MRFLSVKDERSAVTLSIGLCSSLWLESIIDVDGRVPTCAQVAAAHFYAGVDTRFLPVLADVALESFLMHRRSQKGRTCRQKELQPQQKSGQKRQKSR